MDNETVFVVGGVTAKPFREDLKQGAQGEWYGTGEWRGVSVVLTLDHIPEKEYWLAAMEADKSAKSSRNFRISARGREPEEAIAILRSIVEYDEPKATSAGGPTDGPVFVRKQSEYRI